LDQRAAMQWVNANIAAFGGDPGQVMIFGESAGAISVCYHLAAPKSVNLFRAALMESGFCTVSTLQQSLQVGNAIAAGVNCTQTSPSQQISCLRSLSAEELFAASTGSEWFPVIDGFELTSQPLAAIEAGSWNEVPLVLGTNRNENSLWICPQFGNVSSVEYDYLVLRTFGLTIGAQVLDMYPAANYDAPVDAAIEVWSDYTFICPSRRAARAVSASNVPVYLYAFTHVPGFSTGCFGVAHSYELPFVFTELAYAIPYNFTVPEQKLSGDFTAFWIQFATTMNPNFGQTPSWPQYQTNSDMNIVLDLELGVETGYNSKHCDFWDSVAQM